MIENSILNQRYQIQETIGKGGFGKTYLAFDQRAEKRCVIKTIQLKKSEAIKDLDFIKREANVLSSLNHSLIPKFIELISDENDNEVNIYLIQQYIPGKNLFQAVKEGKHLNEKDVVRIALDLVNILEYLQSFSPPIIHRDIKPSNIILSPTGKTFLIDFGAVRDKLLHYDMPNQGVSTIIGTQGYMPIEQFEGKAVPASDIYSLGMTLIYLLSHKEPFQLEKHKLKFNFRPFVNISKEFANLIEKMVDPDWEERFNTARELKKELQKLLNDKKSSKSNIFMPILLTIAGIAGFTAYNFYIDNKVSENTENQVISQKQAEPDSKKPVNNIASTSSHQEAKIIPKPVPSVIKPIKKPIPKKVKSAVKTVPPPKIKNTQNNKYSFIQKQSFTGDCYKYPETVTCIRYSDGFILPVYEKSSSLSNDVPSSDKNIKISRGVYAKYYHVLNTNLIKITPPNYLDKITTNTFSLYLPGLQKKPLIASDKKGNFVIVWQGDDTNSSGIFAQVYDSSGLPRSPQLQVNDTITGNQENPVLAMNNNGNFIIAWESQGQSGAGKALFGKKFNRDGEAFGKEFSISSDKSDNDTFALTIDHKENIFVVFSKRNEKWEYELIEKKYNYQGKFIQFRVASSKNYSGFNPDIAVDNSGNTIITWQNKNNNDFNIYTRKFDINGNHLTTETEVNNFKVNDQMKPKVSADNSGNYIITWQSYGQDDSYWGIFGQKFNKNGKPVDSEFLVNTTTSESQENASVINIGSGNFIIAWENSINKRVDLFIKRFVNGKTFGEEININETPLENSWRHEGYFSQTYANNGNYLMIWKNSYNEIYLKRFKTR